MIAWLRRCAGVTGSRLVKLCAVIFFTGLVSLGFAQENFAHKFRAMRVPPGRIITLSLDSNPTTGFSWQLVGIPDKKVLRFVNREYLPLSQDKIGSPGVEKWSFRTLESGQTAIVLEYRRPWEKDIPAAKREEYDIFVE